MFEFLGMPLGHRNATQRFQRFMDSLFRNCPFVRVYIDNIIVASSTSEDHVLHLQEVVSILAKNKLTLNQKKCAFAQQSLNFLGFHVAAEGFHLPKEKIEAILEQPPPKSIEDLRRFRGLVNYQNFGAAVASHRCIERSQEARQASRRLDSRTLRSLHQL